MDAHLQELNLLIDTLNQSALTERRQETCFFRIQDICFEVRDLDDPEVIYVVYFWNPDATLAMVGRLVSDEFEGRSLGGRWRCYPTGSYGDWSLSGACFGEAIEETACWWEWHQQQLIRKDA